MNITEGSSQRNKTTEISFSPTYLYKRERIQMEHIEKGHTLNFNGYAFFLNRLDRQIVL